jgi:hypothetical protein
VAAHFAWQSSSAARRSAEAAERGVRAGQARHDQDRWQSYVQALAIYADALRELDAWRPLYEQDGYKQALADFRDTARAARARARGVLPTDAVGEDADVLAKRVHATPADADGTLTKDMTAITSTEIEVLLREARAHLDGLQQTADALSAGAG